MKYLIFVLTLFLLSPAWGGEYSITIGKSKEGIPQILKLEKLGVLFKYPSDWSLGEQNEKCNIIYKINYAQVNINHFKPYPVVAYISNSPLIQSGIFTDSLIPSADLDV